MEPKQANHSEELNLWLDKHRRTHPREIELGLERVRQVAANMQLLNPEQTVVTVAGTNGKGSTVAMLEAILRAAGYTVASYTSPHMHRYNERIKINNYCIGDAELCSAFELIEQKRGGISLSFFEFSTLAALQCFKARNPDILLLETGLGGRLDAVNIIDADIAVITSIGIDHVEWLGDNRESIGYEKAGITRPAVPCVCGDTAPPESIKVLKKDRPLYLINEDFGYRKNGKCWDFESPDFNFNKLPLPALFGDIQLQNASCVLMTLKCLAEKFKVSHEVIVKGLTTAYLPGRFQIREQNSDLGNFASIFDISHNPQGVEVMVQNLKSFANGRSLHAVFAILSTKDVDSVVRTVAPLVEHWYLAEPESAHALPVDRLRGVVEQHTNKLNSVQCFNSVSEAYDSAMRNIRNGERLLVFGSTMTVAEALKEQEARLTQAVDGTAA